MADKNKQEADTYFSSRPEKIGAWQGFKQFLWNGETKQCMGRTGGSWGKLKVISSYWSLFLFPFHPNSLSLSFLHPNAEREKFIMLNTLDFWRPSPCERLIFPYLLLRSPVAHQERRKEALSLCKFYFM